MKREKCRDYDDIITLPHHVSDVHPPMPRRDRAAQFSSFAALTGYEGRRGNGTGIRREGDRGIRDGGRAVTCIPLFAAVQ